MPIDRRMGPYLYVSLGWRWMVVPGFNPHIVTAPGHRRKMPFADIAWRPCREDALLSQSHKQGPTLRRRCNLQNGVGAVFCVCLSVVLLQVRRCAELLPDRASASCFGVATAKNSNQPYEAREAKEMIGEGWEKVGKVKNGKSTESRQSRQKVDKVSRIDRNPVQNLFKSFGQWRDYFHYHF